MNKSKSVPNKLVDQCVTPIKSINGERLWVDKVRADYSLKYN